MKALDDGLPTLATTDSGFQNKTALDSAVERIRAGLDDDQLRSALLEYASRTEPRYSITRVAVMLGLGPVRVRQLQHKLKTGKVVAGLALFSEEDLDRMKGRKDGRRREKLKTRWPYPHERPAYPEYMMPSEVAVLVGLSTRQIQRLYKQRKIEAQRYKGRAFISIDEVDRALGQGLLPASPEMLAKMRQMLASRAHETEI